MNDRQLLEAAAKAAGIVIRGPVEKFIAQPDHRAGGFVVRNDRGGDSVWNPLTDDGDALRLAVKMEMRMAAHCNQRQAYAQQTQGPYRPAVQDWGSDPAAALRRAIVRAAAAAPVVE